MNAGVCTRLARALIRLAPGLRHRHRL